MAIRSSFILAGLVLGAPLLAACPQAPPPQPKAPVDLAAPGMIAAVKTFECAGPVDVSALRATRMKNGKQWYEAPPGFAVFGFPAVDLGVAPSPSSRRQTFASVRASPASVLAAVRAAMPEARVSSAGHPDGQIPANANFYDVTWGEPAPGENVNHMSLEGEGPETYVDCDVAR